MATRLKKLRINRVDLVDRAANSHARIALFKRDDPDGTVRIITKTTEEVDPIQKFYDQAMDALNTELDTRIRKGKAKDRGEAYGQLIDERHPIYQAYGKALHMRVESRATPEERTMREEAAAIAKRQQVLASIEKRADELVTAGRAKDRGEAISQIFKNDREAYEAYRKASYTTDRLPQVPREGLQKAPEVGPAYQRAQRLARDLKGNDVYGQYTGRSEVEMMSEVFSMHPEIYEQHRRETLDR